MIWRRRGKVLPIVLKPDRRCTLTDAEQRKEVREAVRAHRDPRIRQLYIMGSFRHDHDVSYASLMLHHGFITDLVELAADIDDGYTSQGINCQRVYPT